MEGYCKAFADIADNFDWDVYTADLAKEMAVKIVNKHMDNNSNEVGEYAVSVAKAVVEGLKRRVSMRNRQSQRYDLIPPE